MKTMRLARSLTKREQAVFATYLKDKRKTSLLRLFYFLVAFKGDKPDKAEMYQSAFRERYDPQKDYRLRNVLRLLSEALSEFIIQEDLKAKLESNIHFRNVRYLESLRKRNLDDLFLAEFSKIRSKAEPMRYADIDFELARVHMLQLYDLLDYKDIPDAIVEASETTLHHLEQYVRTMAAEAEMILDIALHRWHSSPDGKKAPPPKQRPGVSLDLRVGENDNPMAVYFSNMSKAIKAVPQKRLPFLDQALKALDQSGQSPEATCHLKARCLNLMGITYNALRKPKMQFEMFRESIQVLETGGKRSLICLTNYLMGFLFEKRTEEFWKELERYRDWFDDDRSLDMLNSLIQHGHEVSGSYDKALEYLGRQKVHSDGEYLMLKGSLVNIYLQTGDYDLAINEATNALQFLRRRDHDLIRYRYQELIFKLVILMARHEMTLPDTRDTIKDKLRELLAKYYLDIHPHTPRSNRFTWVIERAEHLSKSTL